MIFIIVPAAGMAALVHHDFTVMELFWTFSVYLEAVAIMPQLQMIAETGEAETITTHYLFMLGCYRYIWNDKKSPSKTTGFSKILTITFRALYLINWIYRYHTENYYDKIVIVAGCVQTVLYLDFFYLYATKGTSFLTHFILIRYESYHPCWH